jgi:hypothetical protein
MDRIRLTLFYLAIAWDCLVAKKPKLRPAQIQDIERDLRRHRRRVHFCLEIFMSTLKDLQDAVTAEDQVIDSAITLINGLAEQVKNLAPTQEAIDALAADIKSKSEALAAAVAANTTAAAPPSA